MLAGRVRRIARVHPRVHVVLLALLRPLVQRCLLGVWAISLEEATLKSAVATVFLPLVDTHLPQTENEQQ